MNISIEDSKEDGLENLEHWRKDQKQKKPNVGISFKPKRKTRKETDDIVQSSDIQKLPEEFLEGLDGESEQKVEVDESLRKKKCKKILKFKSALLDQDFIPLDINVSTKFKLVQLDKNQTSSSTQKALEFYNKNLMRKSISRESTQSFLRHKEKVMAKKALGITKKK